jgi:nucleoside-diphosphate-sugar epimerase
VQALQERGDTVRVLALPGEDTSWLEQRGVAVYRGDVSQPETLVAPMRGTEGVFHLAAMIGVWRPFADYHAVNVTGTENVCRAALVEGVRRFIHVSSWTVYGMGRGRTLSEDDPLKPLREPHVLTKAEGDQLVRRMIAKDGLPAVVVRPGTFFGPGDRLHFGRIADRLRTGNWIIIGSGRNALPLVYVTDVVQGLLLALDHPDAVGNVYNIGNDSPLTQREFMTAIAQDVGVRPPRFHIPYRPLYATACLDERLVKLTRSPRKPVVTRLGVALFGTDNRHTIDKARRELGYEAQVPLRAGVGLAAAWFRLQSHAAPAERAVELGAELGAGTS